MNRKCPICESKMKYKAYGETITEESYLSCENKCYAETFHYGTTEIIVFNKAFQYNYTESQVEIRKLQKSIDKEIEYWKKDMRYLGELIEGQKDILYFDEKIGTGVLNEKAIANIKLEELFE